MTTKNGNHQVFFFLYQLGFFVFAFFFNVYHKYGKDFFMSKLWIWDFSERISRISRKLYTPYVFLFLSLVYLVFSRVSCFFRVSCFSRVLYRILSCFSRLNQRFVALALLWQLSMHCVEAIVQTVFLFLLFRFKRSYSQQLLIMVQLQYMYSTYEVEIFYLHK